MLTISKQSLACLVGNWWFFLAAAIMIEAMTGLVLPALMYYLPHPESLWRCAIVAIGVKPSRLACLVWFA